MMNTLSLLEKQLVPFQRRSLDLHRQCKTESFATKIVNGLAPYSLNLTVKILGTLLKLKAYLEPCKTSKMERFVKIVNG